ncbi:SNG1 family protein (plasmid) [Embleya sp. NBC_00888]|uniref:YhgE/Pip domain-containing protein n=1 Tax=Embleya sp. NBC_00888 TaxID=2975960 RepID=UPI002F9153DB|nr:SNG1 family protein [Embleya sp. NBC_00888]
MASNQSTPWVGASRVLRNPRIWVMPSVIVGLLAFLLSILYMGGILDPRRDLHRLPIGLVNTDRGVPSAGGTENLGARITAGIAAAPDPGDTVSWRVLDEASARRRMASGKLYGAIVVPADFTASVAALNTPAPAAPTHPTVTVLTNPGAGSLASSLSTAIAQQALHAASLQLGATLTAAPQAAPGQTTTAGRLLLADPIAVAVAVGHPIAPRSGLGLTAFYYTLLLVLAGFLGGNIISNGVDVGLGYVASEIGPWRTERPLVHITRTHQLAVKCVMSAVLSVLTATLIMLATIGILDMDASHLPLLWVFSICASTAVGLGVQAINAAFGGIGQLVSMFVFIVLALPSSGATIPLQALPGFYRVLSAFEPMRQLSDGVRAILYFDARADAGLTRAWAGIAFGALAGLAFGFAMTTYYDRKQLHRIAPATE